ncbi:MAG: TonB-dependent receptor [Chitinophaga sp.]|uniref:TonB-dependent receptor n=1 Tax=Chitinophaga sp. TaxID=1869181 RepID=UPI001AFF75C4|nr:TonB-dependent receptor [Chitinophaga sp.]MBO9727481.1 TonB-dependent receptor [Chitinophaga sp.]
MKITAVLMIAALLQVHASVAFSQKKLNVNVKNVSLKEVLQLIMTQSDYRLFYNDNKLPENKTVSLKVKDASLEDVLRTVLAGTGFGFEIRPSGLVLIEPGPQLQGLITVTGKVTDGQGLPLPGVTILNKNTGKGALTDEKGNYTLSTPDDAVLTFSLIGFTPQEVSVNHRTTINIVLQTSTSKLDELVVVAYGTQKKANLTGSVGTVNVAQAFKSRPVTNTQELLAGTVPGLNISKGTGAVGSGAAINIRGTSTIGSSSGVLVLIDGIPGNIYTLNPNDIANVSVLKDAASAAIYGSRAANGVILITTKKGGAGKEPVIDISSSVGVQQPQFRLDFVGAADYMKLWDEALVNDGKAPVYGQKGQDDLKAGKLPDNRWYKDIYKKNTLINNNYASISGQKDNISYRVSGSYDYQDGTLPNNDYRRYTVRPDLSIKLRDNLSVSTNIQYTETQLTTPQGGTDLWQSQAARIAPISPVTAAMGQYGIGSSMAGNPIAAVNEGGINKTKVKELMAIFGITYTPLKNWNITGNYAKYSYDDWISSRLNTYYLYDDNGNIAATKNQVNSLKNSTNSSYRNTLQFTTDYTYSLERHHFKGLLGYSQELYNSNNFYASRDGMPFAGIDVLDMGTLNKQNGGTASDVAIQSVFGRINYDYDGKYLVEANLRGDGSSRFAPGHRWGVFPSFSAGWNMHRESFIADHFNWITALKLRASWGVLGDAEKVGSYATASILNFVPNIYGFSNAIVPGAFVDTAVNKNLSWEEAKLGNIGLDASFLENKVGFTVDYFINNRDKILYRAPVSLEFGMKAPYTNLLAMRNRGLDASVFYNDRQGDWNWGATANVSFSKNQITNLAGTGPWIDNNTYTAENGQYQLPYGLQAIGLFQSVDEIAKSPNQGPNVFPGNIKYKDQNGDNIIDGNDRVILNTKVPVMYALNLNLGWRDFDFSANMYGTLNTYRYMSGFEGWAFYLSQNARPMHLDAWRPDNPNASYPRLSIQYTSNDTRYSSYWLRKSNFLKLQNVQLGYTLPKTVLNQLRIKYLRVFVSGQNLATFSGYKGFDPEGGYYPLSRTWAFGVNLKF